jgi:acyl carrier protein
MNDASGGRPTAGMIREWLVDRVAGLLRCPPEIVGIDDSFDRLGLDSATAVGVTLDLEDWLGYPVQPEVFYEHRTIRRLADYLTALGEATDTHTPDVPDAPAQGASPDL